MKIGNDLQSEYLLNNAYLWLKLMMGLSSVSLMATRKPVKLKSLYNHKWESIILYDMRDCVT